MFEFLMRLSPTEKFLIAIGLIIIIAAAFTAD